MPDIRPTVDYTDDPTASHYTVDGFHQDDRVRNTRTGQTGVITFASRHHESDVNVDDMPPGPHGYPHTEIWPHDDMEHLDSKLAENEAERRACKKPCVQHAPHPHEVSSSVHRTDGSYIVASDCSGCGQPIRRVVPFAVPGDANPNLWQMYDRGDVTPLAEIEPTPEPGVEMTAADSLTEVHAGREIRLQGAGRWHVLAEVSPVDADCHITITTAEGATAKVWATRQMQIRTAS